MPLRRQTKNISCALGQLTVTLDDLIEVESMMPLPADGEMGGLSITAGDYEVDRVEDLRASAEATLPGITMMSVFKVTVFIYGMWAKVESSGNSTENNQAAQNILNFLEGRRVRRWAGSHTKAQVLLWCAYMPITWLILLLGLNLFKRLSPDSPVLIASFVLVVLVYLGSLWGYLRMSWRLPVRHPIILKPERERWIDRHGTALEVGVAAFFGVVGITVAIYFGMRSE